MEGKTVQEQLERYLPSISYKQCFHLLSQMRHGFLTPNPFREKMMFLFRDHRNSHLLTILNPLLPDEFQFSEEELRSESTRDYGELKKFRKGIEFVNELTKAVGSAEELGKFHELVKSHKRKEIDDAEFYGSAYKRLRGDFDLMKKLGNIMGIRTTHSYIKLPMSVKLEKGTSLTTGDNQVLNNSFRIYSGSTSVHIVKDPYYIYQYKKVIKQSLLRPCFKGATPAKRRHNATLWWESMRLDLDLVKRMLTVAEVEMRRALGKYKRGKWLVDVGLREHLKEKGVKVKMVEFMFGDLESLMCSPLENWPGVVDELRLAKEEVVQAIRGLDKMVI